MARDGEASATVAVLLGPGCLGKGLIKAKMCKIKTVNCRAS